jgi:uncharacterized protein
MDRPHGTFVWNDLLTTDVEAAKAFFAATLGWTYEDFSLDGQPYFVIRSGSEMVGGLGAIEQGDIEAAQSYWIGFIEVADIDRRYATALNSGALPIRPPHDVPSIGRVCVLRDPTGAAIGWMQSV